MVSNTNNYVYVIGPIPLIIMSLKRFDMSWQYPGPLYEPIKLIPKEWFAYPIREGFIWKQVLSQTRKLRWHCSSLVKLINLKFSNVDDYINVKISKTKFKMCTYLTNVINEWEPLQNKYRKFHICNHKYHMWKHRLLNSYLSLIC